MSAIQKKMMNAIKEAVQKNGLDFEPEYRFSNMGDCYIRQGFDSILSFHFQFNDTYCTLQFYPAGAKPVGTCGFTHATCIKDCYIQYNESEKFKDVISFIEKQLKQFAVVS
jgi:hypothetical protein